MLIVIRDLLPDILHAQILESLDTTVASQVNKHTAQVYNQVLYAFHIHFFLYQLRRLRCRLFC